MIPTPSTIGAPSLEERLDAGEEMCSLGGEFFEQGDEVVIVNEHGDVACRAHADAMLAEEEARLAP
jgi:hypothetical protein